MVELYTLKAHPVNGKRAHDPLQVNGSGGGESLRQKVFFDSGGTPPLPLKLRCGTGAVYDKVLQKELL